MRRRISQVTTSRVTRNVVCPAAMGEVGRLCAQHSYFALTRLTTALCHDLLTSGQAAAIRAAVLADYSERLQIVFN